LSSNGQGNVILNSRDFNMKNMSFFFLLLLSCNIFVADKTLSVAVNLGKPWTFYHPVQGVTGIDVEIIRAVFK
jgi:hypothetical protein